MTTTALYINGCESRNTVLERIDKYLLLFDLSLHHCATAEAAIQFIQSEEDKGDDPCVIIFGPDLAPPLPTARQLHMFRPDTQMLFLVYDNGEDLKQQLHSPTSRIGRHWDVLELKSLQFGEQLEKQLAALAKRQKFRTTLSKISNTLRKTHKPKVSDLQRYSTSLYYLSHIVEHAHDGIIATTVEGTIVKWNAAAAKLFHKTSEQVVGQSIFHIMTGNWATQLSHYYQDLQQGKSDFKECEIEISNMEQDYLVLELTMSLIRGDDGTPIAIATFVRNITERKITENVLNELRKDLERMSYEDGLTGIANRRMFDKTLELEWNRMLRSQRPLSIVLIDIDYFKHYNDHYGHIAGDECLKTVARVLQHTVKRSSDLLARYGGEEFVILLPETNEQSAITLAHKCRYAVHDLSLPHAQSEADQVVTISLGVWSVVPQPQLSPMEALNQADNQLYQAKTGGRNRVSSAPKP